MSGVNGGPPDDPAAGLGPVLVEDWTKSANRLLVPEANADPVTVWRTRPPHPPPPREWIVPGWIPADAVTLLSGAGGSCKTQIAVQLAAAIATGGGPVLSPDVMPSVGPTYRGDPAPVAILSGEDGADEVWRRLNRLPGDAWDDVGDHLRVAEAPGPVWVADKGWSVESTIWDSAIREPFDAGAKLLILDPLGMMFAASENSRPDVSEFMGGLRREIPPGCAVLIVLHPSRSHRESGSTAWWSSARSVLRVETEVQQVGRNADGSIRPPGTRGPKPKGLIAGADVRRSLTVAKSNFGPDGARCWFRIAADRETMAVRETDEANAWVSQS